MKSSLFIGAAIGTAATFISYKQRFTTSYLGHAAVFGASAALSGGLFHLLGADKTSNALNDGEPSDVSLSQEQLEDSCTLNDGKPPKPEDLRKAILLNKRFAKFKDLLAKHKPDQKIEYKAFCGGKTGIMVRKFVDNCVTNEFKIKKPISVTPLGLEKFKDWHGLTFQQFSTLKEPMVEGLLKKHLKAQETGTATATKTKSAMPKAKKAESKKLPSISAKVKAKKKAEVKEAVQEIKEAKQEVKEAVQEVKQAEQKVQKLKKEDAPKSTIKKAEKKVKEAKAEVKEAKQEAKEVVKEVKSQSTGSSDGDILAKLHALNAAIQSF